MCCCLVVLGDAAASLQRSRLLDRFPTRPAPVAFTVARLLAPGSAQEGDSLQFVGLCSPTDSCLIAASNGYAHHFRVEILRRMGRTAAGTRVRAGQAGDGRGRSACLSHGARWGLVLCGWWLQCLSAMPAVT